MRVRLKPLEEQVIVITGASSGIGLATALEAARRGARLFLIARDPEGLASAHSRCEAEGAEVEHLVADVGDHATVEMAAQQAVERFGGFDTWVNNAGVSVYGELRDTPLDDARDVFETNYWGVVHGSLVAAEHFRRRARGDGAYGGAIINIGSVESDRGVPLHGHYSASKHAVKGFTDVLRMELEKEGLPVSVTLIKPSAINTPFPERSANYMVEEAKLPEPTYAPEVVARYVLDAAEHPVRDLTIGGKDGLIAKMGMVFPRLTDRFMEATMFEQQKKDAPFVGDRHGTVDEPDPGSGHVHGTAEHELQSSLYTQVQRHPLAAASIALAAGAAVAALAGRN
ncbi:MAG TPA: SDR family oxidoreductase [Rubricoccaceae bacterium]|nr:SDR family oxidoreductase [Rubricoccaceae bacterium]